MRLIPFISKAFAQQLIRQYGTLLARREVLGEWIDVSGAVFKAEWLRYADTLTGVAETVRVMAVDLAIARGNDSHYTAVVVLSYHPVERMYQVDAAVQGSSPKFRPNLPLPLDKRAADVV